MRKTMIEIAVHQKTEWGNIFTLKNRHGLRIKWNGREFVVPRQFQSDGCSVPRLLWRLVSPQIHPKTLRAAIGHDYIYRVHLVGWTRAEADKMFYELMVEDGMARFSAWIAYKGVRIFGGYSWNESYARYREGR